MKTFWVVRDEYDFYYVSNVEPEFQKANYKKLYQSSYDAARYIPLFVRKRMGVELGIGQKAKFKMVKVK